MGNQHPSFLKLNNFKIYIIINTYTNMEKKCGQCQIIKPINKYRKHINTENSYAETCKKCLIEKDKIRKKNLRLKRMEATIVKCEVCEERKALKNFAKLKKFYKKKICLACYPKFLSEQTSLNEKKSNVNYRLKKSLAARLRNVLDKNSSTMNYIGCNIQYLREWFEYNLDKSMNWNNYGSYWSIGHIIPICKFDLTIEDEKLKCWNWSNMIPKCILSDVKIDTNQVDYIIEKLVKFKEEGSTTKWFSGDLLTIDFINLKISNSS